MFFGDEELTLGIVYLSGWLHYGYQWQYVHDDESEGFAALPENQRIALELIYFGRPWIKNPLDKSRAKQAKMTLRKRMGVDKWNVFKGMYESLGNDVASQFAFYDLTGAARPPSIELPKNLL